jgi:asparagine synthase (glutamine-hydrolysing)
MCGIAGIYNLNNKAVEKREIDVLTDAVKHRGPDGRGIWIENNVALGHRRLAILDLTSKGKQPMSYSNDRFWITLNGEIYNFIEIKDRLVKKGYGFASESDTEVILAAYQEWGEKMLDMFNGMWAFAVYDKNKKTLFLSRDRFGVKPLYYYQGNDKIIFSSEVQAIHKVLGNKYTLNEKVIKDIASGSFVNQGTRQTYIKDVYSLPGGFNLIVKNNKVEVKEWYKLKKVSVPDNFSEQTTKLKDLFFDACKIRLRSDVPIGTCLSGGIDSGSITAAINSFEQKDAGRFSKYTHRAFCASFPHTPIDESKKAKLLAKELGSNLDVINVNAPTKKDLEIAMKYCDGPMHALAFFPIWSLYRYIKNHGITVTLDGQGPDEILGGYRPVLEALKAAIELKNPGWFLDVYKTYSAQGETSQFSSKWYTIKVAGILLFRKPIIFVTSILSLLGLSKMNEDLKKFLNRNKYSFDFAKKSIGFNNSFDEELFEEFFQSPLPGILNQYDRCSMAHGVECRMPFMDYRIVEFIFSLPPESKVGGGYTKKILREAMKGIVPDKIRLEKTKIGFNAPIVDWFRGPLKDFMLEQMSKPEFITSKYFDGEKIKKDFDHFLNVFNPQWDDAWKFWPPVHLTWWMNYNKIK